MMVVGCYAFRGRGRDGPEASKQTKPLPFLAQRQEPQHREDLSHRTAASPTSLPRAGMVSSVFEPTQPRGCASMWDVCVWYMTVQVIDFGVAGRLFQLGLSWFALLT